MNLALPGLALAEQLYRAVEAQGYGRKGTHALMLALAQLSNLSNGRRTAPTRIHANLAVPAGTRPTMPDSTPGPTSSPRHPRRVAASCWWTTTRRAAVRWRGCWSSTASR